MNISSTNSHDCKKELRDASLRATPARLGVLEALETSTMPIDVASVIEYLKKHSVLADNVTVFRILNTLTDKGLVKPIQFNEGKMRYEYAGKPEHHHFICQKCGDVQDVTGCNIKDLEMDISKKKKVLVMSHSLEFFGLCADCQR